MSYKSAALGALLLAASATAAVAVDADKAPALTPAAAVEGFCAAWSTPDGAERNRLLTRVFAADGVYSDPTPILAAGRAALSDEIGRFQTRNPGARFRCSAPQTHHNFMRVSWSLMQADGKVAIQGTDFHELGPDGLIRRVTGFFGPPPTLEPSR